MQHSGSGIELGIATGPTWLAAVLEDFDAFLVDHAAAERKASAVAVSLITHYPDRIELVRAMMDLAREELEHFYQVYRRIEARGLELGPDRKDEYVRALRGAVRRGSDAYFLDRLIVSAIVEARGCERFRLVAEALSEPDLACFYRAISESEERHHAVFIALARSYFPADAVALRTHELVAVEAEIVRGLPARAGLH